MDKIRLAILLADKQLPKLHSNTETLPILFKNLFKQFNDISLSFYKAYEEELPQTPQIYTACLITGSRHSVLELETWSKKLAEFIQSANYNKLIGVCYGHQLVAQCLGGTVKRVGWHIGVHTLTWQFPPPSYCNSSIYKARFHHEDQVITLPKEAVCLASSPYCECALLRVSDKILTMQYHPEFTQPYQIKLLKSRLKGKVSESEYQNYSRTTELLDDKSILKNIIRNFLLSGHP